MDRDRVIELGNKYYTNNLTMEEAAELLSQYATDRGKTNEQVTLLLNALPALVMQLSSFIQTALEWYANKYHISILCTVEDNSIKPIKFL